MTEDQPKPINGKDTGLKEAQEAFASAFLASKTLPNGMIGIDPRQLALDVETEIVRVDALVEELAAQGLIDHARLVHRYVQRIRQATSRFTHREVIVPSGPLPPAVS